MNNIDIILVIVFFINFILSTLIFIHRKESRGSTFFAIAAYSTALWVFAMFFFRNIQDIKLLIAPTKTLYVAGILIGVNFLYFSSMFLEEAIKKNKGMFISTSILASLAILLTMFSTSIIASVSFYNGERIVEFGPLYVLYALLLSFYFLWAYINFLEKFKRTPDPLKRGQLLYVVIGTLISVIFGLVFDIFIPYAGSFTFYWLGPAITIVFVVTTSFAIFKHRLFNIKVIATELLTFAIWIFLLIRTLLANTWQERIIDGSLLVLVVFFGILLIRSVLREVKQREELEFLTTQLKIANEELKRLDAAKSEFISIAGHQLRAPLTVIKGYVSMLLEGSLGAVTKLAEDSMKKVAISAEQLIKLIADLLDLSRIESGRMHYEFKPILLDDIVKEVVSEVDHVAKSKGLALIYRSRNDAKKLVSADSDKIREVVMNFIDNAIKYTAAGQITVEIIPEIKNGKEWLAFKVQDSGIGIKSEDVKKMFTKFARTEEARRIRADGMGLGLYVAKKIVEDHGGEVRVESPGLGKGSAFYTQLPMIK